MGTPAGARKRTSLNAAVHLGASQIQAELGDGHVNLVSAKAVVLTDTHLGIVMEYAAGGNLTNYVTEKWDTAEERGGLMLSEDEARYFFQVSTRVLHPGVCAVCSFKDNVDAHAKSNHCRVSDGMPDDARSNTSTLSSSCTRTMSHTEI